MYQHTLHTLIHTNNISQSGIWLEYHRACDIMYQAIGTCIPEHQTCCVGWEWLLSGYGHAYLSIRHALWVEDGYHGSQGSFPMWLKSCSEQKQRKNCTLAWEIRQLPNGVLFAFNSVPLNNKQTNKQTCKTIMYNISQLYSNSVHFTHQIPHDYPPFTPTPTCTVQLGWYVGKEVSTLEKIQPFI